MWTFRKKKNHGLAQFRYSSFRWNNPNTIKAMIDAHYRWLGEHICLKGLSHYSSDTDLVQLYYEDVRRVHLNFLKEEKKLNNRLDIIHRKMYLIFLREWKKDATKRRKK